MVGSREIPEMFPGYVEGYLAQGGVDWPDLPGLSAAIGEAATDSGGNTEPAEPLSFWQRLKERYTRDLAANVLSTVVLLGLLATIAAVAVPRNWQPRITERFGSVAVYALLAVGLVAAGYLAYVETTGNEAVCGPVGDCNSVQQSQYALLFGFLPIAVLGAIGYVALLIAYVAARAGGESIRPYARAATFAMAAFGVLFSTYLTFLEPFVIGATCAWCLTSAVCMALIALLTAGPGWQALDTLEKKLAFAR